VGQLKPIGVYKASERSKDADELKKKNKWNKDAYIRHCWPSLTQCPESSQSSSESTLWWHNAA